MRRVQLAANCNNRCVFCAQSSPFHAEEAGYEQFVDQLDEAEVMLVGGEPTLNPRLEQWVERFTAQGVRVGVQTNARLLGREPERATRLAAVGLRRLEVALLGSTAAAHDYHTQVPGSFFETCNGIRAAIAAGIQVRVTTLVTRSNFRQLAEWVRLAAALGVLQLEMRSVLPFGRAASRQRLEPPHELATPHILAAIEQAKRLGVECQARGASEDDFSVSGVEPTSRLLSIKKMAGAEQVLADCSTHRPAAPRTGEWSPA
ncbi:MAG: radical SAM protein [Polyangiaceae bacterium]|nr:radical SAM protein [Polyangiaceae bacterium]